MYLARFVQVVYRDSIGDNIKGVVLVGEDRIHIQILDNIVREGRVARKFAPVHAKARNASSFVVLGEMADPTAAHIKYCYIFVPRGRKVLLVELFQGLDCAVVDVGNETGGVVEDRIR